MILERNDILGRLLASKVVAVVRLDNGDQLVQVAEALLAGGVTTIEFTVSTPGALEMIRAAADRFGDRVLMGAGTVLDPETARAAILAGAEFIVTPTLNLETIRLCKRYGKPIMPGAFTPTEILTVAPTGGISKDNAADYLRAGAVAVGVGGKLVDKVAVAAGDWAAITAEAQALMQSVENLQSW